MTFIVTFGPKIFPFSSSKFQTETYSPVLLILLRSNFTLKSNVLEGSPEHLGILTFSPLTSETSFWQLKKQGKGQFILPLFNNLIGILIKLLLFVVLKFKEELTHLNVGLMVKESF